MPQGLDPHDLKLLLVIQREAFDYFRKHTHPITGLVADKSKPGWPASVAATGMGLACYPAAVERGFIERGAAVERVLAALRFLERSPQGPQADASGYKGFYYHFLDLETGRRAFESELSTVDSAFLLAGILAAADYFDGENSAEAELRRLADALYRRVDWPWALNGQACLAHGWRPESGFLAAHWQGYDEALLMVVLALGSPTHPLPAECYPAYMASAEWKNVYGYEHFFAGPLFIHQYSHMLLDVRGIQDAAIGRYGIDYFENSRRATLVQREYARRNPLEFEGYGENCWGLTACDGPGPARLTIKNVERVFHEYVARGAPDGPDDGTIAPWATAASLPFAPEVVLPAIRYFSDIKLHEPEPYGYKNSFNRTMPVEPPGPLGWVSPYHFGINMAPMALMIENYLSGLPWAVSRRSPYLAAGLRRAGFRGGWLE
ncbi:MAG: glucoamylase family protein [Anaerolineales bacterium]